MFFVSRTYIIPLSSTSQQLYFILTKQINLYFYFILDKIDHDVTLLAYNHYCNMMFVICCIFVFLWWYKTLITQRRIDLQ